MRSPAVRLPPRSPAAILVRSRSRLHSRYVEAEMVVSGGRAMRAHLFGLVVLALCTLGVAVYSLFFNENMVAFVDLFLDALDTDYEVLWRFLLYAPFVSSGLVLFAASTAIYCSRLTLAEAKELDSRLDRVTHQESTCCERHCGSTARGVLRGALAAMGVVFLLQLVFASGYLMFLKLMFSSIENMAVSTQGLSDMESDVSTLQLAVFNECCFEAGWSAQGEVLACPADGAAPTCELPERAQEFADRLCACHTSTRYDEFAALVRGSNMCSLLSNAVATISDTDLIPGTTLPISAIVPVYDARVVGPNGTAAEDTESEAPPRGYGCGFGGYAKAFQWMQFKYLSDQSMGVAVAVVIVSALEIIVVLGTLCLLASDSDERFFKEMTREIAVGKLDLDPERPSLTPASAPQPPAARVSATPPRRPRNPWPRAQRQAVPPSPEV